MNVTNTMWTSVSEMLKVPLSSKLVLYSLSFMRVKEVGFEHSVQGSCRTIVQFVSFSPKEGKTVINAS